MQKVICVWMFLKVGTQLFLCFKLPERLFASLHLVNENYKYCLSKEKWKRIEKISAFLSAFYQIKNMISTSIYHTSNLYFL